MLHELTFTTKLPKNVVITDNSSLWWCTTFSTIPNVFCVLEEE